MSIQAAPADATASASLPVGVEVILDLSRLLSRALHAVPTGIDRVELTYARQLLAAIPERLHFAAINPFGFYGRLPRAGVLRFLNDTEARWANREKTSRTSLMVEAAASFARLAPRAVPRPAPGVRRYYIQASPHHLDLPERVRAKLDSEQAQFLCLVHDLIPIEYPEYARPNGAVTHKRRIATMAALADGLIANSQATADSMLRFLDGSHPVRIRAAHLGCEPLGNGGESPPSIPHPYFVMLSTIEPRKNHLLLLNVWRRMIETLGPDRTPHLAIVGRRGWENENVVDMIERCEAIRGHVHEMPGLSDRSVGALLQNARALLLPSFAEGFGMPVTEALLAGTPVICSDLPALREAGGPVPDFIDPIDGPAWLNAIVEYSAEGSLTRSRQMERLQGWTAPTWAAHIATVLDLIRELDADRSHRS